ncbi:hypothetical protein [Chitinophaga tropicalis]|uniref:Adhesin n=1 Tax=Chitinophaga tropicalis TaxID=2683588 RepID=A0A7K1U9V6_9BACT|nr:hypothetical protein [Chitinophaga tropicalis]MVT11151.1 hypothetical protein [Chitinophaga tropicalis]
MATKNDPKVLGREELKELFKNGRLPDENHFANLIDSTINKQEDGFTKDEENGMLIAALGTSKRLVSFYRTNDDLKPFFVMEKDDRENPGLRMQSYTNIEKDELRDKKSFFLHQDGNMGIGQPCSPGLKMDVGGFVGMEGRTGTFVTGKVPANGKWHTIIPHQNNCQAYEVIARTGMTGSGRFAILHGYALSAYGRSHSKIRQTSAYYGFCWNKLKLRWVGGTHDYALQLRTNRNYGAEVGIYYRVTRLWDDETFMPPGYYY